MKRERAFTKRIFVVFTVVFIMTWTINLSAADGDLIVNGNMGVGTATPQTPAPNSQPSNIDANDVYLRSAGKWVSEAPILGKAVLSCSACSYDGYSISMNPNAVAAYGGYYAMLYSGSYDSGGGGCSGTIYTCSKYYIGGGNWSGCSCSGRDYDHCGGECPYVFSWTGKDYVNDNTIIYQLDSPKKEISQVRELKHLDLSGEVVKVKIKEIDPETSYIDKISILIADTKGKSVKKTELKPVFASRDFKKIQKSDNKYLVTNDGDEVLVHFEKAPPSRGKGWTRKVYVKAEGYYVNKKQ